MILNKVQIIVIAMMLLEFLHNIRLVVVSGEMRGKYESGGLNWRGAQRNFIIHLLLLSFIIIMVIILSLYTATLHCSRFADYLVAGHER